MKRRRFIKTATVASMVFPAIPMLGQSVKLKEKGLSLNQSLVLKDFYDEAEESPSLVTNGNDETWLFSLRRMSYPENHELISSFRFDGQCWMENDPVTKSSGQYETPVAACAQGGKPIVAWTEIKGDRWLINTSRLDNDGFSLPYTFPVKHGRSINPVLIAPHKARNWIAWENLHDGVFSIYLSKYENGQWTYPIIINKGETSCFDPAIAEAKNGDLFLAYVWTGGFHQNIEMVVVNGDTLRIKESIAVAIGGGHRDRVNINAKPALAFDARDNLWISYENNRNTSRFEDGDNYTGERCCAILSYQNGKIVEIGNAGKWLFKDENDHKPTFVKDTQGKLYLFTHCGGTFESATWKYRMSWLDPQSGWQQPQTLLDTNIKGLMITPAVAFDNNNKFWLATSNEKFFHGEEIANHEDATQARLSEFKLLQYGPPELSPDFNPVQFVETKVEEFAPDEKTIGTLSGHPRVKRRTRTIDSETYTLIYGNLHEHSNSSNCWPAGNDGSLHDDYRFGMYSEGYDFVGMTDHAGSTSEIHWRKNLRLADFYNESESFVAIPAVEWTLQSDPELDDIQHGAGHYNIIFASSEDAEKYIRNKHELYCPRTPETDIAPALWKMLDEKKIQCVTIPHHSADKVHPVDWNVTDPRYVTTVEIFQCRGNNEYPGCPRERNLSRHTPTHHKRAYIDYAFKNKNYKMGFIASGDHNNMGVGVAALWVKEISREGILEALRNRRTFATTGDKMYIDLMINGTPMGSVSRSGKIPEMAIDVLGQYPLEKVEILRNSRVIHQFHMDKEVLEFRQNYSDLNYMDEPDVLYYYVRATQKNKAIAWSSPIWVERV